MSCVSLGYRYVIQGTHGLFLARFLRGSRQTEDLLGSLEEYVPDPVTVAASGKWVPDALCLFSAAKKRSAAITTRISHPLRASSFVRV